MKKLFILLFILFILIGCKEKFESNGSLYGNITIKSEFLSYFDVSGVEVKIKGTNLSTVTDAKGVFVLRDIKKGNYQVVLSKENFVTTEKNISIKSGDVTTLSEELKLYGAIIKGSIKSNEVTVDYNITIKDSLGESRFLNLKQPGDFSFFVENEDEYDLVINSNGYNIKEEKVNVKQNSIVTLDQYYFTSTVGDLNLNFVDDYGIVRLQLRKDNNNHFLDEIEIPEDKNYNIENIEEGQYILRVTKYGYEEYYSNINIKKGFENEVKGIDLKKVKKDTGNVKGYINFEKIENNNDHNFIISLANSFNNLKTINSGNKFDFNIEFKPGLYELRIFNENFEYYRKDIDIKSNETTLVGVVELERKEKDTLEIKIVADREISDKINVNFADKNYLVNSGEILKIKNVKYGTYLLNANLENFVQGKWPITVNNSYSKIIDLNLNAKKSTLSGYINKQEDNGTIINVELFKKVNNNYELEKSTFVKDEYLFSFKDLEEGEYKIDIFSTGYFKTSLNDINVEFGKDVEINEVFLLSKKLDEKGIKGVVHLENVGAQSGVMVLARNTKGESFITNSDTKGEFLLTEVTSGIYNFEFSKLGFKTKEINDILIEPGEIKSLEDIVVLESVSGVLSGRIILEDSINSENIEIELLGSNKTNLKSKTDEGGFFTIEAPINEIYSGLKIKKDIVYEEKEFVKNIQLNENSEYKFLFINNEDYYILKKKMFNPTGSITSDSINDFSETIIEIVSKETDIRYITNVTKSGNYKFDQLIPEGLYLKRVINPQSEIVESEVLINIDNKVIDNKTELKMIKGSLSGKVNNKNMSNYSDIELILENSENSFKTIVNIDGTFEFKYIDIGIYSLSLDKSGFEKIEIENLKIEKAKLNNLENEILLSDLTSPVINDVIINGGNEIKSLDAFFSILSYESGTGVDKMIISDNVNFDNSSWIDFKFQHIYQLPDIKGENILYFKLIDYSGNESEIFEKKYFIKEISNQINLYESLGENVSEGVLENDFVITKGDYILDRNLTVGKDVILEIEAGTNITFEDKTIFEINGKLNINGIENKPVKFLNNTENGTSEIRINYINFNMVYLKGEEIENVLNSYRNKMLDKTRTRDFSELENIKIDFDENDYNNFDLNSNKISYFEYKGKLIFNGNGLVENSKINHIQTNEYLYINKSEIDKLHKLENYYKPSMCFIKSSYIKDGILTDSIIIDSELISTYNELEIKNSIMINVKSQEIISNNCYLENAEGIKKVINSVISGSNISNDIRFNKSIVFNNEFNKDYKVEIFDYENIVLYNNFSSDIYLNAFGNLLTGNNIRSQIFMEKYRPHTDEEKYGKNYLIAIGNYFFSNSEEEIQTRINYSDESDLSTVIFNPFIEKEIVPFEKFYLDLDYNKVIKPIITEMVLVEKDNDLMKYDLYVSKYEEIILNYNIFNLERNNNLKVDSVWSDKIEYPNRDISFLEIVNYCNWLSDKENLPLAYNKNGELIDENGILTGDLSKVKGYRLPSSNEWIYFAKGGNISKGYDFPGSNIYTEVMNSFGPKQPGLLKGNELDIYDLMGNVAEIVHKTNLNELSYIGLGSNYHFAIKIDEMKARSEEIILEKDEKINDVGFRIVRSVK